MNKPKTWHTVYNKFMYTADWVIEKALSPTTLIFDHVPPSPAELRKLIANEIDALYEPHKGDPIWDEAYKNWRTFFYKEDHIND